LAEATATAPGLTEEPGWLAERRQEGASLVETLELPTKKVKGWEFTDLRGLKLDAYENAPAEVVVSGGSDDVVVMRLEEALSEQPDLLRDRLGSLVPAEDPFVARNEANWTDGVLIHVPRNVVCDEAIKVRLDLDSPGKAVHWRTLIVLEEGAQAEVWEHYGSESDETDAMLNTVVELSVGQNANLHYVATQDISEKAWLFSSQRSEVERDGKLDWAALGFGGGNGKVRMTTNLAGQGSEARVTGGYAGGNSQHLDYDTLQEHAAEDTFSDLAFRGVLANSSTAVWRGMIKVDEGAQRTDAFQECRNMLLSPDAHADAIPGLEILADDVACTHAAAIAQVDKDQLFYLNSRGLSEEDGRSLVVEGFLQALVERLGEGPVRDEIAARIEARLDEIL
jgi:Fe-S cluster assembly protein SufD